MNSLLKYGLFAGIVVAGVWVWDLAKKAATQFSVRIVAYGTPAMSSWILTVPLVFEIRNPSPVSVNIDRAIADLYIMKGSQWVAAGHVDQPLRVPAGQSRQIVNAQANLIKIFGGNILSTLETFGAAINNQLKIKVDVTPIYAGITLPTQSFTDTVSIR